MLDILWNILIKFSKQIANTFAKIINGCKGEFKILSNIWDGAFWINSQKLTPLYYFAKTSTLDVWQGSGYAFELASNVEDVSFLNQLEYQR